MEPTSPASSTPTPAQARPANQPSQNGKKRQAPSQLALLRKRIRQNLITCPVAISILRDLGLRKRSILNSGKFLAWTVDPTDPIFNSIHQYVANGQPSLPLAPCHPRQFGTKIGGILRVTPGGITPEFNDNPENRGELRMMVWKCGRPLDIRNCIERGLKVWREKAGSAWGPGFYFNDRLEEAIDKSYDRRYFMDGEEKTDVFQTGNVVYLFLCEVLLGNNMYTTYTKELDAPDVVGQQRTLLKDMQTSPVVSLKCEGEWRPDPRGNQEIDDCVWPLGESIRDLNNDIVYWGNEFVVYDERRIIPRFLVKVEVTEELVKEKICLKIYQIDKN